MCECCCFQPSGFRGEIHSNGGLCCWQWTQVRSRAPVAELCKARAIATDRISGTRAVQVRFNVLGMEHYRGLSEGNELCTHLESLCLASHSRSRLLRRSERSISLSSKRLLASSSASFSRKNVVPLYFGLLRFPPLDFPGSGFSSTALLGLRPFIILLYLSF